MKGYDVVDAGPFAGVIDASGKINASDGSYVWNIPDSAVLSDNVKVKVMDAEATFDWVFGISNQFALRGGLFLESPTGSSTSIPAATATNITWSFKGDINFVNVFYDPD